MKNLRIVAVAALATSLFLPAQDKKNEPVDAAAKAPAVAANNTIGVVDLVKAIEQYPKWIKYQGELETMQNAIKERLEQMTKEIAELKGAIEVAGPDSDERKQKLFEYEFALQRREGTAKVMRDRWELEQARALLAVYEDLEVAIAKVAKARGVTIVLRMHHMGPSAGNPGKLGEKTVQGRLNAFERREVLYAADQVDLTADLIKLLMVPIEDKPGSNDKPSPEKAPATPKGGG